MSWDAIGNNATESNKVSFLSFPEGVTIIRALDESPHTRWQHWIPSAKRSVTCPGKGCPVCELIAAAKANGEKPMYGSSKKHSINVLNRTNGEVEILEQGNNFWEDVRLLFTDNGNITNYDLKVRRTGMTMNGTKYRVDKQPDAPLTEAELALAEENKVVLAEHLSAPTNEQLIRLINGEDPKDVFSTKQESDEPTVEDVKLA